jgi:CubicO group peptidase (beta-lactamase class C family)
MSVNRDPVTELMARGVADGVFPGAVLLCARRHEILYHRAFGVADLRIRRPVQTDAVFDLASLTKPLATAVAMMLLVQKNRLDLTTCMGDLLPVPADCPQAGITMDMLLRHTSGLPAHREYFRQIAGRPDPVRHLHDLILAEPLASVPGEREVYSDLGYMLLAWVIETVTRTRLDRFVRDRVYVPLGIDDLFFIDLTTGKCRWRRTAWFPPGTAPGGAGFSPGRWKMRMPGPVAVSRDMPDCSALLKRSMASAWRCCWQSNRNIPGFWIRKSPACLSENIPDGPGWRGWIPRLRPGHPQAGIFPPGPWDTWDSPVPPSGWIRIPV